MSFDAKQIARRALGWAKKPSNLEWRIREAKEQSDPAGNGLVYFQSTWMTIPQAEEVLANMKP
jgi:hypothetical protein